MELHFDELPSVELETILHQRCSLPPSYCTKLVKVMQNLQVRAPDRKFPFNTRLPNPGSVADSLLQSVTCIFRVF